MVTVGGPGAGAVVTGGDGAVGVEGDAPLEHAATDISKTIKKMKCGIVLDAGGAAGQVEPITRRGSTLA